MRRGSARRECSAVRQAAGEVRNESDRVDSTRLDSTWRVVSCRARAVRRWRRGTGRADGRGARSSGEARREMSQVTCPAPSPTRSSARASSPLHFLSRVPLLYTTLHANYFSHTRAITSRSSHRVPSRVLKLTCARLMPPALSSPLLSSRLVPNSSRLLLRRNLQVPAFRSAPLRSVRLLLHTAVLYMTSLRFTADGADLSDMRAHNFCEPLKYITFSVELARNRGTRIGAAAHEL